MRPDKKVLGREVYLWLLANIEEHAFELLDHLTDTKGLIANGTRHYADRVGLDDQDIEDFLLQEIVAMQGPLSERFREIADRWFV